MVEAHVALAERGLASREGKPSVDDLAVGLHFPGVSLPCPLSISTIIIQLGFEVFEVYVEVAGGLVNEDFL